MLSMMTKNDFIVEGAEKYDSFEIAQSIEKISEGYEKIIDKDIETKKAFLKENFGTQFTDEQYNLIAAFGDGVYWEGHGDGFFDGIADERERQDW